MNYDELEEEVKNEINEKLNQVVSNEIFEGNLYENKYSYIEKLLTDIMALGYNFGDSQKAIKDIYELQSQLYGEGDKLHDIIESRVQSTATYFPSLIKIFSSFYKATQEGDDADKILDNVKFSLEIL